MGIGRFPGVKWLGCGFNYPPHLKPRLKKEQSYTSTPTLSHRVLFQVEIFTDIFMDSYRVNVSIPCLYISTGAVLEVSKNGGLWFYKSCLYIFGSIPCKTGDLLSKVMLSAYYMTKQRNTKIWSGNQIRSPAVRSVANTKCDRCVRLSALYTKQRYMFQYVHLMYQLNALTMNDITFTLLRHVSA